MANRTVTIRRADGTEVEANAEDALITAGLTAADYYLMQAENEALRGRVEKLAADLAELKHPADEPQTGEPPDELWLQWYGDDEDNYLWPDDAYRAGVTWSQFRVWRRDVRYVRAEAVETWRPMGGELPSTAIEIRRRALVFPAPTADEPPAVGSHPHGWFICWWSAGNAWEWRPLAGSAAPDEEE